MNTRHFTRVNYSVGASISYGDEVVICSINNMSLHGMYLTTEHEIPLNTLVHVTVYHSSLPSLRVHARVIRREQNGVGLEINNFNVNSFVKLRNIVTEYSSNKGAIMQETYKVLNCIS